MPGTLSSYGRPGWQAPTQGDELDERTLVTLEGGRGGEKREGGMCGVHPTRVLHIGKEGRKDNGRRKAGKGEAVWARTRRIPLCT